MSQPKFTFTVFVCSPMMLVLLSWVGSYDLILVSCVILVLYYPNWRIASLAGVAVAWVNFEQFIMCGLILFLALGIKDGFRRKNIKSALITSFITYFCLRFFLTTHGVNQIRLTGLITWIQQPGYFASTFSVLPATLLTTTPSLFVLVHFWKKLCGPTFFEGVRVTVGVLIALFLALISLDQTRIAAIHLLPVAFVLSERISNSASPKVLESIRLNLYLLALLSPAVFVWSSTVHFTGWSNLLLNV